MKKFKSFLKEDKKPFGVEPKKLEESLKKIVGRNPKFKVTQCSSKEEDDGTSSVSFSMKHEDGWGIKGKISSVSPSSTRTRWKCEASIINYNTDYQVTQFSDYTKASPLNMTLSFESAIDSTIKASVSLVKSHDTEEAKRNKK